MKDAFFKMIINIHRITEPEVSFDSVMIFTSFLTGSWIIFLKQFYSTENKKMAAIFVWNIHDDLLGKRKKVVMCQRGLVSKNFSESQQSKDQRG